MNPSSIYNRAIESIADTARRLPRDESGSISIISVFAVLVLVMLLGMVLNSGREVDRKVKMQNAADAATASGVVVISRSMNTLAFTNHLLSDIFALTAYFREANARVAETLTPPILDNWERIAPAFAGSEFQTFADLGRAIEEKVPHERKIVLTFSEWSAAASELMLPVFTAILAGERISEFQRDLVRVTPVLAQAATDEVARRHGQSWPKPTVLRGMLWSTEGEPLVAGGRMLPVVDPVSDAVPNRATYLATARAQRFALAHIYLRWWNQVSLPLFDNYGKMSQFSNLWRVFTGGRLQELLDAEYPERNLPCQIEFPPAAPLDRNEELERRYMLVGVVYCQRPRVEMPRIFHRPTTTNQQSYAQAMLFVPKRRLVKHYIPPRNRSGNGGGHGGGNGGWCPNPDAATGIPGQGLSLGGPPPPLVPPPRDAPLPSEPPGSTPSDGTGGYYAVVRQDERIYPEHWSLINQNWTAQLVPATSSNIPRILGRDPWPEGQGTGRNSGLSRVSAYDFLWLSNH